MRLIEKRVGLLFAAFRLAFLLVLFRAVWLQGVRGGELRADARTQQVTTRHRARDPRRDARPPRQRARGLRGRRDDLRHAVPGGGQAEGGPASCAELLDEPEDEICSKTLSTADSGFAYIAHKVDLVTAERIRKLELAGIGTLPDRAASTRRARTAPG